ncbi:MAG: inositol monophosphatase family protein [Desulfurivibrionaceae bacterium]
MKRIEKWLVEADHQTVRLAETAVAAALEAGAIISEMYDNPHRIRMKGAIDLVTEADLAAEKAILAILSREFPETAVLAEESSSDYARIPSGPVWIIDPLDGTTNFAHGFPYFCVSIAYSVDRQTEFGVIYCPVLDELFWAGRARGAWLNGKRISVTKTSVLLESLLATGFPYDIPGNLERIIAQLHKVLPVVRDLRRGGAAALDLAFVACGRLDGFWEVDLKPWDTAAGQLLVEEAGGVVTDFKGGAWTPYLPEILASNRRLHPLISRLL